MRIRHWRLTIFGLVMFTGFPAFALAMGGTADVVGKVVRSSNATVGGSTLISNGTILSGDAVNVGEGGSVIISYSPTGRAALAASTHVRFSSAKGNIVAQLLSGTLAVERENKDAFVVKTSTHRVEPQGEGRAEFVVAFLPDKRTLIETQHGKVAITETSSGESYTLAEGLLAEIIASATGFPSQEKKQPGTVIGQAVTSTGATRDAKPLPSEEWIFAGDTVSTGAAGRAIIQLWPTNHVTLDENTSASFTRLVERVWVHLQNGTIVVENTGENNVLVATTRFHVEPASADPSTIRVEVRPDNSTYIQSVVGDVKIREVQSEQTYLLPAGQKTLVPANASGVPGLQPLRENPTPAPTPSTPPSNPLPATAAGGISHNTLIILGVAVGGGIAGAAAAFSSGGGGGSQPASPSVP
jgi:ferric-dicitrate binding protein FerR (iron transport regulator)